MPAPDGKPMAQSDPEELTPRSDTATAVRFPLWVKLALFAVVLLMIAVGIVGFVAVDEADTRVRETRDELQTAILETIADGIEAELAQAQDGLDAVGRAMVDQSIDEESRLTLAKIFVESNEVLDHALLYMADGTRPLPIAEPEARGLTPPDPLPPALLQDATELNAALGSARIEVDGPRVLLVVPIRFDGEVTGFVASQIPLTGIQQLVDRAAQAHFDQQPEPLMVVDEQLRVLADPGRTRASTLASAADEPVFEGIDPRALTGQFSRTSATTRVDGTEAIGTIKGMNARPWVLVAMVPTRWARGAVEDLQLTVYLYLGAAVLVALVASPLLARRITSPLIQLSRFASDIAQRNFSSRVEIKTSDELAMVGRAMSQAAADLQSSERRIREELEIRSDLGRYLPAELVDKVVKREQDMALGGERREITVLFADVVAFTPLTENLPPEQVVQILNELFTIVTEIVFRHRGTVDKFIGDCVMAMWGAPTALEDHAARALEAAEEIISWLEVGNASWEEKYGVKVQIAIGINSGEAVVGNVGSDSRMEYTAIGTTVNLAARLEAIARPQQILISAQTAELAGEGFTLVPMGTREVAGYSDPLQLFELVT